MHKDKFGTRLTKAKSNSGKYNWLFLAGGPGADSQYLNELLECLKVPGQLWRVDLPENGSNQLSDTYQNDYDFEKWEPALRYLLKSIDNPILVGHSFSGLYPLLFPEIENDLRGLVLLNSATRPWIENAMKMAKIKNLPSFEKEMAEFLSNKSDETFAKARKIFYHYYFNPGQLEKGTKILSRAPFNYHASCWWLTKATSIDF
jgi:pimeloyl-ACP methyl ester carboxylesterase